MPEYNQYNVTITRMVPMISALVVEATSAAEARAEALRIGGERANNQFAIPESALDTPGAVDIGSLAMLAQPNWRGAGFQIKKRLFSEALVALNVHSAKMKFRKVANTSTYELTDLRFFRDTQQVNRASVGFMVISGRELEPIPATKEFVTEALKKANILAPESVAKAFEGEFNLNADTKELNLVCNEVAFELITDE